MIKDENLQLIASTYLVKNVNGETSKNLYKILTKSYELQYLKYAEIIHQQFIEQKTLLKELCYQKHQEAVSYQMNGHSSKTSMNGKAKFDSTNYNSTSSGGSVNGHSSRQKDHSLHVAHEKFHKKSDKKY
jgi:hypothetical protein